MAGTELDQAFNRLPAGGPFTTLQLVQFPTAVRVSSGAAFVGGVALGAAALAGLALKARRRWGRDAAIAALTVAALALLINVIATATQVGARAVIDPALAIVGMIALMVLLGRIPRPRLPAAGTEARSWMEDERESAGGLARM